MIKKIKYYISLFSRSFKGYRRSILVLTGLGFLSGILGGVGINALIPLFSFVAGDGSAGEDFISQSIQKLFVFLNIDFTLYFLLLFIITLFVSKAVVIVAFSYISGRITASYEANLQHSLLKNILKADWPYLAQQKMGHLEKVLLRNVRENSALLSQFSQAIMSVSNLIIYTFVAINISWFITLITFVSGGAMFFIILKPLAYRIRNISREDEEVMRNSAHYINETILGLKSIKALNVSGKISESAHKYFLKIRSLSIRSNVLSIISSAFMEPVSIIFISVVFVVSFGRPDFNFATLITVVYLIRQIFIYIERMQSYVLGFSAKAPYVESVLRHKKESTDNEETSEGSLPFIFEDSLVFKDVGFFYVNGQQVLSDLSFSIKKGEMAGLIGPSGSGKTTIVDLVLRLLKPNKGNILLDGKNISQIDMYEWRKNIGYVSQDIFLMNDTVSANIKFYDDFISDEDMIEAAKMANIYKHIQTLPKKFNTVIGERGTMLSVGQRQRVVIARVLARKPKLLILDEATSALDNESEVKIQKIIEGFKSRITVFVIAHRLSTVMNSDKLFVLKDGKIIEEGLPRELLKDRGSYFYKVYNIRE